MKREERENAQKSSPLSGQENEAHEYVRATSEGTRLRTLSLYLIQSIVEKYGGKVGVDLATDTIMIDVPEDKRVQCAQEIEAQVGAMCW